LQESMYMQSVSLRVNPKILFLPVPDFEELGRKPAKKPEKELAQIQNSKQSGLV